MIENFTAALGRLEAHAPCEGKVKARSCVFVWRSFNFLSQMFHYDVTISDFPETPNARTRSKKGCKTTFLSWHPPPPPPFPVSSARVRTYTLRAHLTRHGYPKQQEQLICCSPALPRCYQPGLVHTYTLSATFCQTHSRCLWATAHKLGNECYGGLSVSLGAWQPLHRLTSPVRRPQRQIYVTRVLMNTGSVLLEMISATLAGGGPRRQWAHTRGPMARSGNSHGKKGNANGNKGEPVHAGSRGPRRTGARMPAVFVTFCSSLTKSEGQLAVVHVAEHQRNNRNTYKKESIAMMRRRSWLPWVMLPPIFVIFTRFWKFYTTSRPCCVLLSVLCCQYLFIL